MPGSFRAPLSCRQNEPDRRTRVLKPAAFSYRAPTLLSEALDLLAEHGSDAKLLAGGQSLVPALNFRLGRFGVLVDLNRIEELAYIRHEGKLLRIGAMTRQREIEVSALVRERVPLLAAATRMVAHLPIRTRGTIGGSLSHADPAAEYPAVILALDGVLVLQNRKGSRQVPARDFFLGLFTTAVQPDEILVEVQLPVAERGQGYAFDEVSRRQGDYAIVGIAAAISVGGGRISGARLSACGVGEAALRLNAAESILIGQEPAPEVFQKAASVAAASVEPRSDLHADAEYRRRMVASLVRRVASQAARTAVGERT